MMDQLEFENKIKKLRHRYEEGDLKKAVYIADKIDFRDIKDINLLLFISMVYEDYGDYDAARSYVEMAYEVAPIKSRLYFALCNIYIKCEDFKKAKKIYLDFISVFPNDNRKTLLRYYFLKKKGAGIDQRCRVLEEYVQEEKEEKAMFELACVYDELGEKEKVIETCEYIVNFFGLKTTGYGRRALELKKRYEELSSEEEELLRNYKRETREDIKKKTNIVYQNIRRPKLMVVSEKEDIKNIKEKVEKIHRKKTITEEEFFKDDDIKDTHKLLQESRYIDDVRKDSEKLAFMSEKEKEEKNENIVIRENKFDKYRKRSLKRGEKEMKLEDLKQHMIIEAYSREEAFNIAQEELAILHRALKTEGKVAKVSAYNLNEKGFRYYEDKIKGRDLIVENAGQLKNELIDELEEYIIRNGKKNIIALTDIINNFDKLANTRPSFIERFDVYSVLSETKQEKITDNINDIKKDFGANADNEVNVKKVEIENNNNEKPTNENVRPKEKEILKVKDMSVDDFVEYCKSYAHSIDCSIPGKSIPALYERIEEMVEQGIALTEKRAIDLIEKAAENAETPKLFYKPKYEKDGSLVLMEDHIIEK